MTLFTTLLVLLAERLFKLGNLTIVWRHCFAG